MLTLPDGAAQPGENVQCGFGAHHEGDIGRRQGRQDKGTPTQEGDPGAQFFRLFFIHRVIIGNTRGDGQLSG